MIRRAEKLLTTLRQKAYAGWSYKNRDKSKDKEKAEKERIIARWMRENKKFVRLLDRVAFEIQAGKWGHEDKVDAKLVKDLLEENGYTDLPFSSGDLLRYWNKGPVYSRKKRK